MGKQRKSDDTTFMLIVHAAIHLNDRRSRYWQMVQRLFYMVLNRDPALREKMLSLRNAPDLKKED